MGFLRRLFGGGGDGDWQPDRSAEKVQGANRPPLNRTLPKFPFPIEAVRGRNALHHLEKLRKQGAREGFTATLLGNAESLQAMSELPELNEMSAEEILREAEELDGQEWLQRKRDLDGDEEECLPELGDWPARAEQNNSIRANLQIAGTGYESQVFIARIPALRSHEVFAHLLFGGWNACPYPHEHVAVARSWNERFGVEVVAVTHDTVELEVARPPRDRELAVALAWEHYQYCNDSVDQGFETVHRLAASLLVSRYWFFWWD